MSACVIDVVIKFGGSAITDKNKLETLRQKQLSQAAHCIRSCKDAGLTCVVVHGAGSFGHHHARKYQVNIGTTSLHSKDEIQEKLWGYCLTRQSVTKLNKLVVDSLLETGVSAIGCSPGSSWETDNREPVNWPSDIIAAYLKRGFVPVLHGDCCLDDKLGCCILSGDTVIKSLSSLFTVRRVVFLTDVAGIYDRPPEQTDAQLIKNIIVSSDGQVKDMISTSQSKHDVTGGIKLKLNTAVAIIVQSKGQCPVYVCCVDSPDASCVCQGVSGYPGGNFTAIFMEGSSPGIKSEDL